MRKDGWTAMTKTTGAFGDYANAPSTIISQSALTKVVQLYQEVLQIQSNILGSALYIRSIATGSQKLFVTLTINHSCN
jgi:hypothetical protein